MVRITIMLASSIDGKIADFNGYWAPLCPYDEERFENALSTTNAVVVGWRTVAHSGLSFTPKGPRKNTFLKIVIDPRGVLPPSHHFYTMSNETGIIVFGKYGLFNEERKKELERKGVRVILYEQYPIDVKFIVRLLAMEYGVQSILVAGGGTTAWQFLREVDGVELHITFVPVLLGDTPFAIVRAPPLPYPGFRLKLLNAEICKCGNEIVARYIKTSTGLREDSYPNV